MNKLLTVCIAFAISQVASCRSFVEGRISKQPAFHSVTGGQGGSLEEARAFEIGPNDKVLLNFGQIKTYIDPVTGKWRINNLEKGRYVVSVDSQTAEYGYVGTA